ncbi:glucosamine 6-phosphate N-acetyltransferase-like isoform X2 [Acanthaster planci]|uniref:Glucosamine 6-phosphate N-acetyltransferase n=1 Tax=Acanthaster planci TaxID=133434 RepID=A0A8B7Z1U0_ACAPL|nr:glucosamine 6-phosphate N-acetyltransferase-like isoform X2 [Acanthaster planci]
MENGMEDILMYDKSLLTGIDFEGRSKVKFHSSASPSNPGDSLVLRPLSTGYMQLLSELTVVGEVTLDKYLARFNKMKEGGMYYVTVVEDTSRNCIVASATLILEQKFIHECALRGRIEEVVVHKDYRGKQLGKLLMSALTLLSQDLGCYKTTLECGESNIPFYEKFGYVKDKEVYMQNRH